MNPAPVRWTWSRFEALSGAEVYAILHLRGVVFVVEQNCPYLDVDRLDPQAWHLCGWDSDGRLAAYMRAFAPGVRSAEAQLGRVVNAPAVRGKGFGRLLLAEGLARMEETFGPTEITIHAQSYLVNFYGDFGFVIEGEPFLEDGIPHRHMRRR